MISLFSEANLKSEILFQGRLHVHVEGEAGVDAGGMAKDVLSDFLELVLMPQSGLFLTIDGDTYAPSTDSSVSETAYESIGRILMKAILDGHTLRVPFAAHVWKFILSGHESVLDLSDLEDYDERFHKTLRENLLEVDIKDGARLMLTFEGLKRNGSTQNVTNANKMEYIYLLLRQRLFASCIDKLLAIRRGFWADIGKLVEREDQLTVTERGSRPLLSVHKFKKLLESLGWSDLRSLLSGPAICTAEDIVGQIEWDPLQRQPGVENSVRYLKRYISVMDSTKIRQFLRFVTGSPCLPFGGLDKGKRIRLLRSRGGCDRLPTVHTCFNTLELPLYGSYEVLKEKFDAALLTAGCLLE